MYSHQVSNSNGVLAPKIWLLLGQSWITSFLTLCTNVFPHYNVHMLIENAVVYMKSTLFTKSYVQKYFPLYFIVRIVIVYMYITLFTNILTHKCTKT